MKIAIMQPYIFPYLGYFQLINSVDTFVIYDNIEYTKKGWINRNRLVFNSKIEHFTINIVKDSDYLNVDERKVSPVFYDKELNKILNKIKQNYGKAPFFNEVFPFIKNIFTHKTENLYEYIYHSLISVVNYLEIETTVLKSSALDIDHKLKSADKVIAICKSLNAKIYINPIGGKELYQKETFKKQGIDLYFIENELTPYAQFKNDFIPGLSIIDVLMFNSKEEVKEMLNQYHLV